MAYIKSDFIESVLEQIDIVQVVEKFCSDLKKRGKTYFCKSPFTGEKSASFAVDPVRQRFKCFSSGKSGDAVTFIMETQGYSYPEAIEWLAASINKAVVYEDAEWAKRKAEQAKQKEDLRPLLKKAQELYRTAYDALPATHPARVDAEQKRKYTREQIIDWQIGYAPGQAYLYEEFVRLGKLQQARELGLIGDRADKYWHRVTYPITDSRGLLIGFAGRDVSGKENSAKWINPQDSIVYKKDKTWFGLDRAAKHIHGIAEAWLVEGYNDVIAWQENGIINTIAGCGTAIADGQIALLRKICQKVVFCMDADKAGMKAMLKYTPVFLAAGFRVDVVLLPGVDPDDFVRLYADSIKKYSLNALVEVTEARVDGVKFLIDHYVQGNELQKADGARELVKILSKINDETYLEIYMAWLAKESKIARTKLNNWLKDDKKTNEADKEEQQMYVLPQEVKVPLSELKDDIFKYGMFVANNKIWMMTGTDKPYSFSSCSNFSIEIIQHMQDEKLPMKLVRICNISGESRIFDVPSENLNTPQAFDNAMTNHGNFLWTGGRNEFQRLRQYLFDRMGVGSKIEVLGWQPENFWVWNNAITIPGKGNQDIDENGTWKHGKSSYYIPSANRIYEHNSFKFTPQKKVVLLHSNTTFLQYITKMKEVHREHAITGTLFSIATMFLDIIEDKLGNFPLLFLYGPPSTGKDQLIEACQSFYGHPQTPIHIGNKISTSKAQVRKFAQFRNIIVHLSEYRPGDQSLDELLKGFWDRRGYERGTIDSAYGTETVPIHSSVIYTGNHYPDDDALITRTIAEEMTKSDFSLEDKKRYQELKDMYKNGISHMTAELLQFRPLWEEKFKETFRMVESNMKKDLTIATTHDRLISNISVLGTAYELMKDKIQFPFGWEDFIRHMKVGLDKQIRKLNTASVSMKWWDCFLAAIRTKQDPLVNGKEFELKDNKLVINFTHVYNRVAMQWWAQYHEQVPSKSKISDLLKKDSGFIEEKAAYRFQEARTSAWIIELDSLPIKEDLAQVVQWQRQASAYNPYEATATTATPATPQNQPSNSANLFDDPATQEEPPY